VKTCATCKHERDDSEFVSHWHGGVTKGCLGCRSRALKSFRKNKADPGVSRREREAREALSARGLRSCKKCGTTKALGEFYSDARGRRGACKECIADHARAKPGNAPTSEPLNCSKCKVTKPATEFYKNKNFASGRRSWCRGCCKERGPVNWTRYYEANKEILAANYAKWARENPHKSNERGRRRRAIEGGPGVTDQEWADTIEYFGGRCAYCLAATKLTMEHVTAVTRGGTHEPSNAVPACRACNSSKRNNSLLSCLSSRRLIGRRMGNHFSA